MAYRVDAGMERIEVAGANSSLDRPPAEPQLEELLPRDNPMLLRGQLRDRALLGSLIASPRQCTYTGYWRGLGGHGPRLPGNSARVARGL